MSSPAAAAAAPNRLSVESGRAQGSRDTNASAIAYFNRFQRKRDEPEFDNLTTEDFAGPQSIQLTFHDWAVDLVEHPPIYQDKPVNPNTIKNYYGLVKTRFQEDPRFKDHEDLRGDPAWFTTCRNDMVKELEDKINKGNVDGDYDDSGVGVSLVRHNPDRLDGYDEDVPDLRTMMRELAASTIPNNFQERATKNRPSSEMLFMN